MATAAPTISMAEYLRTSYRPDVHFVNGELEERFLGEFTHARLQYLLCNMFGLHEEDWGVVGAVEPRIRVSENNVRIADVAILRGDAPDEEVIVAPPLICIEVMSPEDRVARATVVLDDYWRMGVKNVWLLDPARRRVYSYDGELHLEPLAVLRV